MDRRDLVAYLTRDWAKVARAKDDHWRQRKARFGAAEALQVASELRQHARIACPGWPTDEEREEDLQTHREVAAKLRQTPAVDRR